MTAAYGFHGTDDKIRISVHVYILGRAGINLELLVSPAPSAEIVSPFRRVRRTACRTGEVVLKRIGPSLSALAASRSRGDACQHDSGSAKTLPSRIHSLGGHPLKRLLRILGREGQL